MSYLQSLASSVNMPYVNITLDVGAAINAYKFLWSNPDWLNNVVIHLGDFHFMKENFQVIYLLTFLLSIIFTRETISTFGTAPGHLTFLLNH